MQDDFYSEGSYLNFPKTKKKVSLFVNSYAFFSTSIKLYQPFSRRAILFKKGLIILAKTVPSILKLISNKKEKGGFIIWIERQLGKKLFSSIYYPTIFDKLVIQLTTEEESILGYVKIGLNKKGNAKILREKQAIEILLTNTNLLLDNYLIEEGVYKKNEFIIVKEIEGISKELTELEISTILNRLKKSQEFVLKEHPGFIKLYHNSVKSNIKELKEFLEIVRNISKVKYKLVYEHGDFAPWNIIEDNEGNIKLFDLEYFIKDGIEYLDKFNYYYQTEKLLKKLETNELITSLKTKIKIREFDIIFGTFLVNKILYKVKEDSPFNNEIELLKIIFKKIK